jgi:hypothetical protein
MIIDNTDKIAQFVPKVFDGDTFLYTELLDRRKKSGNNRGRIVKSFYHRGRDNFYEHVPQIIEMCEYFKVRAYTRLSTRSFAKVGRLFTQLVVDQSLSGNWEGMRSTYYTACGRSKPLEKRWLFDVDWFEETPDVRALLARPEVITTVPSRKGFHIITKPFDVRGLNLSKIMLHKDNPVNTYIPEGAA